MNNCIQGFCKRAPELSRCRQFYNAYPQILGLITQELQNEDIMVAFEKELLAHPADLVVVVGDVTSTMACSIVAKEWTSGCFPYPSPDSEDILRLGH